MDGTKLIKNFNEFILEFGTGYEGGPASRDNIKISDKILDEIDLEIEEDEKDEKNIPILSDIKEQHELDPYGEENWNEANYNYSTWKGSVFSFLKQLNDEYLDLLLYNIEGADRKKGEDIIEEILLYMSDEEEGPILTSEEHKALSKDIYDLLELCYLEEDEGPDPDWIYDQWRDSHLP